MRVQSFRGDGAWEGIGIGGFRGVGRVLRVEGFRVRLLAVLCLKGFRIVGLAFGG